MVASMHGHTSTRSTRSRNQVGATNRSTISPGKVSKGAQDDSTGRRGDDRGRLAGAIRPRLASPANGPPRMVALTSNRQQSSLGNGDVGGLSTSRSMPSLGSAAGLEDFNNRIKTDVARRSGMESCSEEKAVARRASTPEPPDFYVSTTQSAYVSGLNTPDSKVPILDPYLHRGRLHERWIVRASQRLGDLACLKYGSVKEFFRLYDANCDGVLDFDEFSKGITMCQLDHLFPRSLQRTLFDRIDTDKSGTIELDEFSSFLGRGEKQDQKRKADDLETRSVHLQPIHDHRLQRIKNKLSYCLNKAVPSSSTGLADNRTMFLKKQFAMLNENAASQGIGLDDLARALGPKGMNLQIEGDDIKSLVKEMDNNGDGTVTIKEFATFLNLDDDQPLYQPLFDGRRRNVNIMQSHVDAPAPAASPEEEFFKRRADQLHSAAVPSKMLDAAIRRERDARNPSTKGQHIRPSVRPHSPPWTVGDDTLTISTPSGRTVVDVWDLPPPTRHLSKIKRSLTSSMRAIPRTEAEGRDDAKYSYASEGGPFVAARAQEEETVSAGRRSLSSLSSSEDLFSSLGEARLEEATASALARSRKLAKPTWADIGHGGIGSEAGTDEYSSYYAGPDERFTTTNSERFATLIKEKKIEKGQRSAGFCRQRPSDSAAGATQRQCRSEVRSNKIREHRERIALSIKTEEVAARLKGERRVRGKARTRLRYNKWVNTMDNWLGDEVPKLADFNRRQFPDQNFRFRGGQQVHQVLGGP